MTLTPHTAVGTVAELPPTLWQLAQRNPEVTVEGSLRAVFVVALAMAVLLGLATAGLAVYRYRNRRDPALRALVVGLVLIAVAPLPFRIYVTGTIPPVLRDVVPLFLQTLGLVAILWAMYGDPRAAEGRLRQRVTADDLVVVAFSLGLAAAALVFGGLVESGVVGVAAAAAGAFATFVASQAARAAHRYRSPAMASLSVGIFCLAALPTPISAILLAAGSLPAAVVVGVVSGAILIGEAAMFATLVYR